MGWGAWISLILSLVKELPDIVRWVKEHRKPNKEAAKDVGPIVRRALKREGIGVAPEVKREG